jgi:MFS family permease
MRDGLNYVRNEPTIFLILIFTLILVVLSRPYQILLPIITEDILNVGATGLGILMSVSGIGAIFCSTLIASLPNKKRGLMLLVSGLVLSIALGFFAFSKSWYLSLIMITFIGMGDTGRATLSNTLVQYYVADEYRGRVMSILIMQFGLMSFGVFFASLVAEAVGVQMALAGLAVALATLTLIIMAFGHRLRALD